MTEETALILEKLDTMGRDISDLKEDVSGLKEDVSGLKNRMDSMEDRMTAMEGEMDEIRKVTTDTHVMIENEIRKNIQLVAEGHLDLTRKLNEALEMEKTNESLQLHMNYLVSEMKRFENWNEMMLRENEGGPREPKAAQG